MSNYEILVTVRGPERTTETQYGPRSERDTYASMTIPVNSGSAWQIFKFAVESATSGEVLPSPYSLEEIADRLKP